jgi:hypothetical protein
LSSSDPKPSRQEVSPLAQVFEQVGDVIANSVANAVGSLADLITGAKSLQDVFLEMVQSIIQGIANIFLEIAKTQIVNTLKGLFGSLGGGNQTIGGGGFLGVLGPLVFGGGFATGGLVLGAGTGSSDSILARLSNGEFVINASAVDYWGAGTFEALNAMQVPTALISDRQSSGYGGGTVTIQNTYNIPGGDGLNQSSYQLAREQAEMVERARRRGR